MTEIPACGFCRKGAEEARKIFIGIRFDWDGNRFDGSICDECMRGFIIHLAWQDRDEFEKLVEEARAYKPPTDEPENLS